MLLPFEERNVCSFIVTLNAFDVRHTCDTADVQAILPFPPNPLKHVLCDVPYCGVDAMTTGPFQMLGSLCVIDTNFTILQYFLLKLWRNETIR